MPALVSILFPCYNAESYLEFALTSILNQSYKHLEVICVNDGSTDNTLKILNQYQEKDSRIIIVNNTVNEGLISSLNKSFNSISGEYFARMDADDFSSPERIYTLVNFLIKHGEYDLVSSAYNYFYNKISKGNYNPPVGTLPNALKFISLFSTPLNHAGIMGRTRLITGGTYYYDKNYPHAEDFELFSRLAWQSVSLSNIPTSLYWVRLNSKSVSARFGTIQTQTNLSIVKRNLEQYLGIENEPDSIYLKLITNRVDEIVSLTELKQGLHLLNDYYEKAKKALSLNDAEKTEIEKYLSLHTLNIIVQCNKIRFISLKQKNIPFFFSTLLMLSPKHIFFLIKKVGGKLFTLKT